MKERTRSTFSRPPPPPQIIDGLVSTYNQTAPREKQILIAGVITAVDGASGTPAELVTARAVFWEGVGSLLGASGGIG